MTDEEPYKHVKAMVTKEKMWIDRVELHREMATTTQHKNQSSSCHSDTELE